ncbi:magnesium chelatase ATPase subunit D [Legionella taurinensis]|uniref:Mg-protoporphyrin IX chelatase n=1 Tax=Legionella taurinensis TaxID=70611 RepID=A0A3A5L296_9GAMM|nr:magnesium chelatase ATPase subunit D [Legionella taurinensis]RJT45210.1 magnesium chelatase ATPase subunit D [Legionella taurinensis]RJT65811.1 magnesium chelatase ATPase subunit D [Legionella taurinensis]STY27052.1 Magnesium-chelatase 60 kDa subunit [Legionella taurinensis]
MKSINSLPIPAMVGLKLAKKALFLLAINPRLKGLMLSAKAGSGKSLLSSAAANLFAGKNLVNLPVHIDEANLLGGVNLEETIRCGHKVVTDGLLSKVNHGILICESINLLSPNISNIVLNALDAGYLRIETTGISKSIQTHFLLIGAYNPDEGVPRKHLMERVGLHVHLPGNDSSELRKKIITHNLLTDEALEAEWQDEEEILMGVIQSARELLPKIELTTEQIRKVVEVAAYCKVEGSRADIFAVEAARAAAALALRDEVLDDDIQLALKCVIFPRAQISEQELATLLQDENKVQQSSNSQDSTEVPSTEEPGQNTTLENYDSDWKTREPSSLEGNQNNQDLDHLDSLSAEIEKMADTVFESEEVILPSDIINLSPFRSRESSSKTGSQGKTLASHGHHIRSRPGDPNKGPIDIIATLRAAAPWQKARKKENRTLVIEKEDIHVKQYSAKAGTLFIFVVDASGSMGINRMRQAKGTVISLLEHAYIHRDQVALISCRGQAGQIILQPTASVELAKKHLDILPTGDATPLASSLMQVFDVIQYAKHIGIHQYILVLMTDGNSNVGIHASQKEDILNELQILCGAMVKAGVQSIVINTRKIVLKQNAAKKIGEWLHANYFDLGSKLDTKLAEKIKGSFQ